MKEQRRSPRYRHDLVVEVHDKRGVRKLHAVDVARHGLFVATDDPPRERHLVQLTIHLPNNPIRAAATVTRVIPRAKSDHEAGAGLQFFALSDEDKAYWDDFIFFLHRTTPARGVERPDLSQPAPEARRPDGPTLPSAATFLVKLKSVERLADFAQTHLAAGGTVLFTPVLRAPGEPVTLVCVHPKTDEEFKLPGIVARAHADRPKRLEIHFLGLNATVMNAFRAFIESGRPPSHDLAAQLAATVTPQPVQTAPVIPEKNDFDLDVDVFDEDTLDTDDRLAHAPSLARGAPVAGGPLPGAATAIAPAAAEPPRAKDPGLKPHTVLLRCESCTMEPYAVDLGPCRGLLGLVANLEPMLSSSSGKVVSVARLVSAEERAHRVQTYIQSGGVLQASVELKAMLDALALADDPVDPADGAPLKGGRSVERLQAAAHHLEEGAPAAHTKVKCHACKNGTLTVERVAI